MNRRRIVTLLAGLVLMTAPAVRSQVPSAQELAEEALLGFDPILLAQGREVLGREDLTAVHDGLRYYFSSDGNRRRFLEDPARHGVQLGGLCARMGGTVAGSPDNYVVHDGRIYLLGSETCRERFAASPDTYLPVAAPPLPSSAAALREGRDLIARAVEATGGAASVDGVRTWRESWLQAQPARDGSTVERRRMVTMAFPGRLRIDRVLAMGTVSEVLNGEEAFSMFGDTVTPGRSGIRQTHQDLLAGHWIAVLQARDRPGFVAASLGRDQAGGATLTRIGIDTPEGARTVFGVDANGRIRTQEFQGRNVDGEVGTVVLALSDHVEVLGLMVPRRVDATVSGRADWPRSGTITELQINVPLAEGTFARPDR
jgi:YHS domain-containing protein